MQKGLGDRIRAFLKSSNISVTDMARDLAISESYAYHILNGRNSIKPNMIEFLHNKNCNINWLISGEGDMYRSYNNVKEENISYLPNDDYEKKIGRSLLELIDMLKLDR